VTAPGAGSSRRLRVLMVSPYSLTRVGGVQGQVLGLARSLRALDVDVRVLAPCDGPPPGPGIMAVGPSVEWENNGSVAPIAPDPNAARRTIDALRDVHPDVVHLHEPVVPGPALTLLLGAELPTVSTHHISGEIGREWLMPALRGQMHRLAARVAVSESARLTAFEAYGGDYEVWWNGIDLAPGGSVSPTPSSRPAVLFVGRHEHRKGLRVLLDAWRGIDRDATLWVVGAGPETDELRGRGDPNVEWLGRVDDAERDARLHGATVFCAPALGGESFGVVLLEAMAAGAAVVAADIDGYRNVATDGIDALLVTPGDADALRVALRRALDDAALRDRLVAAGRRRADQLSMRHLAERYLALYRRVV
jgi:phosphatidylinositol alpha-mannosyltransferase